MSSITRTPFGNDKVSVYATVQYLLPKDIYSLAKVCRSYSAWSKLRDLWLWLYKREGIPLVEGSMRDLKADFKVLYPIIISGRLIEECFGRVIGPMPCIRQDVFANFVYDVADPYAPEELYRNNFVLIVDPSYLEIDLGKDRPFEVDDRGNLIQVDPSIAVDQTCKIKTTLSNLLQLAKFPLKIKEHLPVPRIRDQVLLTVLVEQCRDFPVNIGVRVMRRCVLKKSNNINLTRQLSLISRQSRYHNHVQESVRRRFYFDILEIIRTGTCPDVKFDGIQSGLGNHDDEAGRIRVRGTEVVIIDGEHTYLNVGSYDKDGLCISHFPCDPGNYNVWVVPGGPAEAVPELENLGQSIQSLKLNQDE